MPRPQRRHAGRIYAGLLTLLIVAVVGVAASALYVSAGGAVFGWTGAAFGIDRRPDPADDLLRQGREAAWRGDYDDALVAFDSVLSRRPADRALALERAKVLAWAKRYGEAADALAAVEDPDDVESTLERARFLWWADRPREADSLLSVLLARHPDAREAVELQDLVRPAVEPAVSVAERWVAERPHDPFSHLWLARALVQEGRQDASLAHYRAALGDAGSAEPEVLLEAAGVALGVDSLRFAAAMLDRYLHDVDPSDRDTRVRLARAYSWSGRVDDAAAQYRRVLDAAPDPELRLELARMLDAAGRHDAAAADFRRVLAVRPSREVRRELAATLARGKRYDPALAQLDLLIGDRGETPDLLERARVLALADRYGAAADALLPVLERSPDDVALRLRHARYLWWAGRMPEADAALTALVAREPGHAGALALREEVRAGIDASVDLARHWVALDDTPLNRLRLARALVEAERPGEALRHYRAALPPRPDRDRLFEVVGAAEAADSLDLAIRLVDRYLEQGAAAAPETLLRLARLHAWAGHPDEAARTFGMYLALRPDDSEARFERGQQLAWQDSTRWAAARTELARVVREDTLHAPAFKLLGDLSRWEGDAATALDHYRRAARIDPSLDGLDEGRGLALAMLEAAETPPDATLVAWAVEADGFSDSQGFDWLASRARHHWRIGRATVSATVGQGYTMGRPLVGAGLDSFGMIAGLEGRFPLATGWAGMLEAGVASFQHVDALATWGAGLEYQDSLSSATLRYRREPGMREAATLAAVRAGAVLDRVQLGALTRRGPWSASADVQAQRFAAGAGSGTRWAGTVRGGRALGGGFTAGAMVRSIIADGHAPVTPDAGPLYWAPSAYVAPALTLGYQRALGSSWSVGLRAAPGYAWIDEREGGAVRYDDGETPILEAGASVGFRSGRWALDLSGDWGGNLGSGGYDATALSLRVTRSGGAR